MKHIKIYARVLTLSCLFLLLSACKKTQESPPVDMSSEPPVSESNVYESKYVGCAFTVPPDWDVEEEQKDHKLIDVFPPFGWEVGSYSFISISRYIVDSSVTYEILTCREWLPGFGVYDCVENTEMEIGGMRANRYKCKSSFGGTENTYTYVYAVDAPTDFFRISVQMPETTNPKYKDFEKAVEDVIASLTFYDTLEKVPIEPQGDFCDLAGKSERFTEVLNNLPTASYSEPFYLDEEPNVTKEMRLYDGFNLTLSSSGEGFLDTFDAFYVIEPGAPFTVGGVSLGMSAQEAKTSITEYGSYGYAPDDKVLDTNADLYYSLTDAQGKYHLISVKLDESKQKVIGVFGFYGVIAELIRDGNA